jgi:BMFP domain-containing protein YqiC
MFKIDPKNIDDLANKIKGVLPESLKSSKEEMQKTLKSGAEGVFQKLDLVSREEYDIQVSLLRKCQEKIDELEAKISELEENKTN